MYDLKQAPRAWYERLPNYLMKIGFQRINDNSGLYIKEGPDKKIVLEKIFGYDTLFTRDNDFCKSLEEMSKEFEMEMFGEIKFFFVL